MLDSFTSWLLGLISNLWDSFVEFLTNFLLTLFDALKDIFFFIIDTLLEFVVPLIDTITAPLTVFNPQTYINALPPEILNIMGLLRVGEAMAIVIAALLIRLVMQLIPFVRLGS